MLYFAKKPGTSALINNCHLYNYTQRLPKNQVSFAKALTNTFNLAFTGKLAVHI